MLIRTSMKTIVNEVRIYWCVPSSRRLLQSLQSFLRLKDFVFFSLLQITWWLLYVNFFFKHTIQESRLDIHLKNLPSTLSSNGKNHTHRVHSCNWSKNFKIINAGFLFVPFCY